MNTQEEHERALIEAFIIPARQERYLHLLARPKRRKDILAELAHFKHLDMRWTVPVPHGRAKDIAQFLKSTGAPDLCYAISEAAELDGMEVPLLDALTEIHGAGMGTFLSCLPGRLAYFEDEDQRWILQRGKVRNLR